MQTAGVVSNEYVGLKNLGATGYVNVLLQQLFMTPEFRWTVMSLPDDPSQDKKESLVWQLQTVFSYLQESKFNFYSPKAFCSAFKFYNEPLDVNMQMDVSEFWHLLLDSLPKELVCPFFALKQTIHYIPRDPRCTHLVERTEELFNLTLEIKGHKSLADAMDAYIVGDLLDAYVCKQCDREVPALKRCCFKALPDTLVIQLKRYEFNFETFSRAKINDVCAFPMALDMEPYTREALARKEGLSLPDLVERDKAYYQFQLSGFIVHTGKSANGGRYYAVLRDNVAAQEEVDVTQQKWYKFDDKVVEHFDPAQIPAVGDRGAYILFYHRAQPERPIRQLSKDEAAELVPKAIFNDIVAKNNGDI